jgi:ABC-2 type transport system ATP-binding protein
MKFQVNGLQFQNGFAGVIGPHGVGKTRLLKTMAALDTSDERLVQAEGNGKICYVTRELESFSTMTVKEYLCVMAGRKFVPNECVVPQIEQTLELAHLTRFINQPLGSLSNLLKSQTLLAKAMLGDPELLLLDQVLHGLTEQERMTIGYTLSEIAKDRTLVLAGQPDEPVDGLYDTVCLLHPEKQAVHVSANTAYSWVEGKVWEYVAPELPTFEEGRILSMVKQADDGVYVREIAAEMPFDEVSQVTPTLTDAYLWWSVQQH